MKLLTFLISLLFLTNACHKNNNTNVGNIDTAYTAPTNITRYTKPMAGKWSLKGYYKDYNSSYYDSSDIFDIKYINDTTIKIRESILIYRLFAPASDSNYSIRFRNPLFEYIGDEYEAISYIYKDDIIVYSRGWDGAGSYIYRYLLLNGTRLK